MVVMMMECSVHGLEKENDYIMSILYFNNCWFTNVGEAFIDIGAMQIIKNIWPNERIVNISNMSSYYINQTKNHKFDNTDLVSDYECIKMWDLVGGDANLLILSGMFACDEFINSLDGDQDFISALIKRGVPIVFLGLGQNHYTTEETEHFKQFLDKIKPKLIVSRDRTVYSNFRDYFETINGIDCAYWCKDDYNPSYCLPNQKYDVVTYNRSKEPDKIPTENIIVRANHMQYTFRKKHIKDNILISDSPYDYMTLYACCEKVYTDLVHATIISLQYGKHVHFDRVDNRSLAVYALDGLKKDENNMLYIAEDDLEFQKNHVIEKVRRFFH